MANFTLDTNYHFASGDIGAYPASRWPAGGAPSGAPIGTATNTQTISGGSVTFTGLTAGTSYYATDATGTKYVQFTVPSTSLPTTTTAALASATQTALDTKPTATLDTDATMAANSDTAVASQKATKTALATKPTAVLDTNTSLTANSDANVASQKATKTYTDAAIFVEQVARVQADTANGFAGVCGPTGLYVATKAAPQNLTANKAYYVRVYAPRAMTITSVRWLVITAAGSNDNVDVGIFNGTTGAKIVSSGATAGKLNSTGIQSVSLSTTLAAGTAYYLGLSCGSIGSTAAQVLMTDLAYWEGAKLFGSAMPLLIQGDQTTAHPLPSTGAPASGQVSVVLVAKE